MWIDCITFPSHKADMRCCGLLPKLCHSRAPFLHGLATIPGNQSMSPQEIGVQGNKGSPEVCPFILCEPRDKGALTSVPIEGRFPDPGKSRHYGNTNSVL